MRHRNAGFKLGRNTSHRRALLRNLVTSVLVEDRVQTTVAKAKAVRPHVEKMITLGKRGDLQARRQALSFLMTDKAVTRLFETVAPRYGDRQGGYLRIVRTGFRKGDGGETAFIELLGAEKQLEVKRQKRADIKAKKRADLEKQLEERRKRRRRSRLRIRRDWPSRHSFFVRNINGRISSRDAPVFMQNSRREQSATTRRRGSYS